MITHHASYYDCSSKIATSQHQIELAGLNSSSVVNCGLNHNSSPSTATTSLDSPIIKHNDSIGTGVIFETNDLTHKIKLEEEQQVNDDDDDNHHHHRFNETSQLLKRKKISKDDQDTFDEYSHVDKKISENIYNQYNNTLYANEHHQQPQSINNLHSRQNFGWMKDLRTNNNNNNYSPLVNQQIGIQIINAQSLSSSSSSSVSSSSSSSSSTSSATTSPLRNNKSNYYQQQQQQPNSQTKHSTESLTDTNLMMSGSVGSMLSSSSNQQDSILLLTTAASSAKTSTFIYFSFQKKLI
jgi:hypothetical protein